MSQAGAVGGSGGWQRRSVHGTKQAAEEGRWVTVAHLHHPEDKLDKVVLHGKPKADNERRQQPPTDQRVSDGGGEVRRELAQPLEQRDRPLYPPRPPLPRPTARPTTATAAQVNKRVYDTGDFGGAVADEAQRHLARGIREQQRPHRAVKRRRPWQPAHQDVHATQDRQPVG